VDSREQIVTTAKNEVGANFETTVMQAVIE